MSLHHLPDLPLLAFRPANGRMRLYGGGGSSDGVKYDSLEALYEEQAASARILREQAEANLPGAVQSYTDEVNDVMAGDFAQRQASQAMSDMASANAMDRAATERNLASMGVNPNDPRFAGSLRATETNNAARMAAGANLARNEANQYQLNVAKDAVGTFTGQSNNAATQLGSAASGLGSIYASQSNQQMAQDQAQSNAAGNAVAGGMMALSMFKDGGRVNGYGLRMLARDKAGERRTPVVERHMLGGQAGSQQNQGFFQMQQIAPPPVAQAPQQSGPNMGTMMQAAKAGKEFKNAGGLDGMAARNTDRLGRVAGKFSDSAGNQIQSHAAGMRMAPDQARAAADAYTQAAQSASDPALAQSYADAAANIKAGAGLPAASAERLGAANAAAAEASGASAMSGSAAMSTPATAAAELGTAAGAEAGGAALGSGVANTAATAAGEAALSGSITSGAGALGTGAAAGGSTALASGAGAAGATAAGGALAAAGAALPWVGAAYAVGSLLELWADGGKVGTQRDEDTFAQAWQAGEAEDLRAGGAVPGEWQGNTDNVPALLTEGEHVINAEAAKAIGHGTLAQLNKKGLAMRKQGKTPETIKKVGLGALA